MAKSNPRRTIISEWMMLAREKRQSAQQSSAFAKSRHERYRLAVGERRSTLHDMAAATHWTGLTATRRALLVRLAF